MSAATETLCQALERMTYASDDGTEWEHNAGCEGEADCPACWAEQIRTALAAHAAAHQPRPTHRQIAEAATRAIRFNLPVDGFGDSKRLDEYAAIWGNATAKAVHVLLGGDP